MALWKIGLLVAVLIAGWFYLPRHFDMVVLICALVWGVDYLRGRGSRTEWRRRGSVGHLGALVGVETRRNQASFRFPRGAALGEFSAHSVEVGGRVLDLVELSLPTFRKVPFCFVVRDTTAQLRESDLVENSVIPGIRFEYVLRPVELGGKLEAAANLPDLFNDMVAALGGEDRLRKLGGRDIRVQKVFFNGRTLHFLTVMPEAGPEPGGFEVFLDDAFNIHARLLELVDGVEFKVPM
jgi:hypothetical protein